MTVDFKIIGNWKGIQRQVRALFLALQLFEGDKIMLSKIAKSFRRRAQVCLSFTFVLTS